MANFLVWIKWWFRFIRFCYITTSILSVTLDILQYNKLQLDFQIIRSGGLSLPVGGFLNRLVGSVSLHRHVGSLTLWQKNPIVTRILKFFLECDASWTLGVARTFHGGWADFSHTPDWDNAFVFCCLEWKYIQKKVTWFSATHKFRKLPWTRRRKKVSSWPLAETRWQLVCCVSWIFTFWRFFFSLPFGCFWLDFDLGFFVCICLNSHQMSCHLVTIEE